MSSLHQDLRAAYRDSFVYLFIDLVESDDISVVILLNAIKSAKFAVDVADIGVIDVPIHNVGDNPVAASAIRLRFGQLPPTVRQRAQFLQWHPIQPKGLSLVNPSSIPNFLQ